MYGRPWKLVYAVEHNDKPMAVRQERGTKNKKSRKYIERLIGRKESFSDITAYKPTGRKKKSGIQRDGTGKDSTSAILHGSPWT